MTTAEGSPRPYDVHDFRDLVRDFKTAMLTTITPDGALHARPIPTAQFGSDDDLYFFARASSAQASDVIAHPLVSLSYFAPDGVRFASVAGSAAIVDDRETTKTLWGPWCAEWFPAGPEDPEIRLVRVRVTTVEYWSSPLDPVARLVEFRRPAAAP